MNRRRNFSPPTKYRTPNFFRRLQKYLIPKRKARRGNQSKTLNRFT